MSGRFITIEGGEGAGKSTIMRTVEKWLVQQGRRVVTTREPGGTPLAEMMRELLLDAANRGLTEQAELLLMFAARSQHLDEKIRPALSRGDDVLCDRFTDATYAYQAGGRQLGEDMVARLEALVHPDLQPDLTLLLDLPVAQGLQRASQRSAPDRFEREAIAFFERVRATYLQRAKAYPERFVVIDARCSLSKVRRQVYQALEARLL